MSRRPMTHARRLSLAALTAATLWAPGALAGPEAAKDADAVDRTPKVSGSLTLRYQDSGPNLPADEVKPYFGSLLYGKELKDAGLLNYNARLGVSGKLNHQLAYGMRLMFRNHKQAAFSFPPYEPGFGNAYVVADLFYFTLTPVEGLAIDLGKHKMPLARIANFFWDNDVSPVGVSERYTVSLGDGALGKGQSLTLTAGQWFPTPGLRNSPRTLVLVGQADYRTSFGGEHGITFEAEAGFTKFNGFDRFLAAASTGGAKTPTATTDADGGVSIKETPVLDYAKVNDARITGRNPLWVDASLKVGLKSLGGRPLSAQLGYIHNFMAGPAEGTSAVLPSPGLNATFVGASYGKLVKTWDWSVSYAYEWKGAASVVNGWTDDGFGSDLKGHVLGAEVMPIPDLGLSVQWRSLQDADGRDRSGAPLSEAFADARYSDLRIALAAKF